MFPDQKRKGYIFRISEDDRERQVFEPKNIIQASLEAGNSKHHFIYEKEEAETLSLYMVIVEGIDVLWELSSEEEKCCK
ncbi:hypothetical protein KEJ21_06645 [Candidatus Bathyarchaeota archaeon]|nr:hypothetical protein [Candidatus Bathyarchaeota archaeon]MBS7631251.1 hypothetical protein [Candidatus Bathyarchaeota archaeon]